jgi:hypothetical protein
VCFFTNSISCDHFGRFFACSKKHASGIIGCKAKILCVSDDMPVHIVPCIDFCLVAAPPSTSTIPLFHPVPGAFWLQERCSSEAAPQYRDGQGRLHNRLGLRCDIYCSPLFQRHKALDIQPRLRSIIYLYLHMRSRRLAPHNARSSFHLVSSILLTALTTETRSLRTQTSQAKRAAGIEDFTNHCYSSPGTRTRVAAEAIFSSEEVCWWTCS